jgi:drug/metabolite transporter (DMT)-like permease
MILLGFSWLSISDLLEVTRNNIVCENTQSSEQVAQIHTFTAMKFRENIWAHLAILGANIIYGANYSIAKAIMPEYIKPFGFIVLRGIGGTLLFWLFHVLFIREKVENKDIPKLILGAFLGIAANQMLFFKGLSITTPINAAILMTCTPVLVLLAATIILKEKITISKVTGIISGIIGAMLIIVMGKYFSFGSETMPGDLMVFINASFFGVYLVMIKPMMKKYHPLTVNKWVFFFGLLMSLPFGWGEAQEINWEIMPANILAGVVFVVVGLSFFAYLFNSFALSKVSPSTVSIYIYSQPVFATTIAIASGNDSLSVLKVVAAVLIFGGVYLVSWGK